VKDLAALYLFRAKNRPARLHHQAKTVITTDVVDCLMNKPHRPHFKLLAEALGLLSAWASSG
jgi:hypothetical protein